MKPSFADIQSSARAKLQEPQDAVGAAAVEPLAAPGGGSGGSLDVALSFNLVFHMISNQQRDLIVFKRQVERLRLFYVVRNETTLISCRLR